MRSRLAQAIAIAELAFLCYFIVLNSIYLLFTIVAHVSLRRHGRRWAVSTLDAIVRSPATPAVSIIAPAHNEEATLAESIRSLLMLNYPQFEVVVVNDGSKDRTREVAIEAFNLLRAPVSYAQPIATQPVHGVYRSLANRDLVVIDKANGGKADAINAGINAARYPLVCVIDADSLLEEHALTGAVRPFVEDATTIAAGGIVRIANGCTVARGRVDAVGLPESRLAVFQIVEYLRAFLCGRLAQSAFNGLLVISGAFGVFRRDAVIGAGGFRHDTIGEDMELVTRLHRLYRERRQPYRIVFLPAPVCWTEAPETLRVLSRQRNRWQRGTLQTLAYHKRMMFNPRYGVAGLFSMPYYLIFEAVGPVIEFSGYAMTALALALGLVEWRFIELLFLAAIVYGALLSVTAVILDELSFQRYSRLTDVVRLAAYGVLENFGYRQLTSWWRLRGIVDYLRGQQGWGAMTRKGFSKA